MFSRDFHPSVLLISDNTIYIRREIRIESISLYVCCVIYHFQVCLIVRLAYITPKSIEMKQTKNLCQIEYVIITIKLQEITRST